MIIDLLPTDDQVAIRDSIAGLVAEEFPISRLHRAENVGGMAEESRWAMLAGLGIFGMGVAESKGGVGFGLPEEVTAARELGRGLVSPTVLASIAGAHVASGALFEAIRDGNAIVAFANPMRPFDNLTGTLEVQLLDAEHAHYVLLWNDRRGALYLKPDDCRQKACLDDTIRLERAEINLSAPVAVLEGPDLARRCGLLLAAYLAAVSEGAMNLAVDYAKVREQFGQTIGAFQAIKHYCADMARRTEAAVSQTFFATIDAVNRDDANLFEVAAARLLARDAAAQNGRFGIQIHGGMGFTYEADAHFYLKRGLLMAQIGSSERIEQMQIIASAGPQ